LSHGSEIAAVVPRPENIGTTTVPDRPFVDIARQMIGKKRDEREQQTEKSHG
jgi:hypothetical protein